MLTTSGGHFGLEILHWWCSNCTAEWGLREGTNSFTFIRLSSFSTLWYKKILIFFCNLNLSYFSLLQAAALVHKFRNLDETVIRMGTETNESMLRKMLHFVLKSFLCVCVYMCVCVCVCVCVFVVWPQKMFFVSNCFTGRVPGGLESLCVCQKIVESLLIREICLWICPIIKGSNSLKTLV
jgi:hypothetical protein